MMETKEILKRLSASFGPAGFEEKVAKEIEQLVADEVDEVRRDTLGNVVATINPGGSPHWALFAHMDEIGGVVSKLEEGGFVRITPVGGVDPKILVSQRVRIHTRSGVVDGIVGAVAPHLLDKDKRDKVPMYEELFVDVLDGVERIRVGDPVIVDAEPCELKSGCVSGKALDNRASCAVLVKVCEYLKERRFGFRVSVVFNTTEETGGAGAKGAAYALEPDYAIVVDVTHANEDTGMNRIELGKGPAIAVGAPVDRTLFQRACDVAEKLSIPYQVEPVPGRSGTDTDQVQLVGRGIKTLLISVPLLYMHTPVEVVDPGDVEMAARLIVELFMDFERGGGQCI